MSNDPVSSVTSSSGTGAAAETSTATAGAPTKPAEASAATTISSLEDLKGKAPKVYDAMMMSIAQNITSDMNHHQQRIKEMNRQARQDAGQG
jgi:hypothetical protein